MGRSGLVLGSIEIEIGVWLSRAKAGHWPVIAKHMRKCDINNNTGRTERKARLIRTSAPCFNDGFALIEPSNISNSVASIPTSTRQIWVEGNSGLILRHMVYTPHDQLRRTNRSDGANELDKGESEVMIERAIIGGFV
jgi:hypothetical protein